MSNTPIDNLTQERLKELLNYCHKTGVFTWAIDRNFGTKAGDIAGKKSGDWYCNIGIDYKRYMAHRLAFLYMTGEFPSGNVDHIDHDYRNNSWDNLRVATQQENTKNQSKRRQNTSGTTGISFDKISGTWVAKIGVDMKTLYIGRHKDIKEAIKLRKAAEVKYGFHENHGTATLDNKG